MADETLKKLAEQFMNAGKTEEQRRRDRNASFIEDLLRTAAGNPFTDIVRPSVKQPEPEKSATRLVGCRSCGQVNRVPSVSVVGKKPVCGKCKAEL